MLKYVKDGKKNAVMNHTPTAFRSRKPFLMHYPFFVDFIIVNVH